MPNVDIGIDNSRHYFTEKKHAIKQSDKLTDQLNFAENADLSVAANKIPRKKPASMFSRCFTAVKKNIMKNRH